MNAKECACGEDTTPLSVSISRLRGLDQLFCEGCLRQMFRSSWNKFDAVPVKTKKSLPVTPFLAPKKSVEKAVPPKPELAIVEKTVVREAQDWCKACEIARRFGKVVFCACMI